jgi:hypothetical protein
MVGVGRQWLSTYLCEYIIEREIPRTHLQLQDLGLTAVPRPHGGQKG